MRWEILNFKYNSAQKINDKALPILFLDALIFSFPPRDRVKNVTQSRHLHYLSNCCSILRINIGLFDALNSSFPPSEKVWLGADSGGCWCYKHRCSFSSDPAINEAIDAASSFPRLFFRPGTAWHICSRFSPLSFPTRSCSFRRTSGIVVGLNYTYT